MLSLEDQIRELADQAFEATEPVQFDPNGAEEPIRLGVSRGLLTLVAAIAVIAGAVTISRLVQNTQTETVAPADALLEINDPLDINLDPLIEFSAEKRISSIGEYTTFDFDQLPEGWSAEQNFAVTLSGPPATFWQQVLVRGPGPVRLVVNVTGPLDGTPLMPASESNPGGQPGFLDELPAARSGSLDWVLYGASQVQIVNGGSGLLDVEAASELADMLVRVRTELDWQHEPRFGPGDVPTDIPTLLSGVVDGLAWNVVLDDGLLILLSGPEFAHLGGGPPRFDPPDPTRINSTVESVGVPGGVVVYGHAPDNVASVRLNLLYGSATLPVVPYETDRVAFAVPISDRLDPTTVEFIDADANVIETMSLARLPPYGS